jgi:ATP-dependent RNA helicase RhlE
MCEPEENAFVRDIEKLINQKIEIIRDNPFPQTDKPMTTKEKQVFEKEKKQRKQEYFTAKNKNKANFNRRNN